MQAQATGQSVEVTSETTATTEVMANPDGTFTMTSAESPVRVWQNGAWTAVNTNLVQDLDGSYSPAATAEQVAFSGGGTAPLVQLSSGSEQVSFTWPYPLPPPTVSGPTATYLSVFTGVDLQLTAFSDHYSEVLIVHNAAAAASLAKQNIQMIAGATGLNLGTTSSDGLSATDSYGNTVFSGGRGIAWDSSSSSAGPAATSTDPGGGRVTPLSISMTAADAAGSSIPAWSTLSVKPPTSALTATGLVFPVYIDPSINPSYQNMAVVLSNGAPYYSSAGGNLKVGDCGTWAGCNGIGVARSYFNFPTSLGPRNGAVAHIYTAQVQADEIWSADGCTATSVTLYESGGISGSTAWGGPYTTPIQTLSSANGGGTSCAAGYLTFNNSTVVSYAQTDASNGWPTLTFGLISGNEASQYYWKQFGDTSGSQPVLTVTYEYPPSTPTGLTISGVFSCGGVNYTTTGTPTLQAKATDNNPSPSQVGLDFQVYDSGGTLVRYTHTLLWTNSDVLGSWATNASNSNNTAPIGDGTYTFDAQATSPGTYSPAQTSARSGKYSFTVNTVSPSTPAISTFDYPPGYWGSPSGSPGKMTFTSTAGGVAVDGFAYSFAGSGSEPVPTGCSYSTYNNTTNGVVAASAGTATITLPSGLAPGPHNIYVKAFDKSRRVSSGDAVYSFYVPPTIGGESGWHQEAENLSWTAPSGDYIYKEGPSGIWDGTYQEHFVANQANQTFTANFSVGVAADYALGAQVTDANHYAELSFAVDGTTLSVNGQASFNTYSAATTTSYLELGGLHLTAGSHTLAVTMVGTTGQNYLYNGTYGGVSISNYNDNGYSAGIDYLTAVPINAATYSSINAAMNDHGIAADNTTQSTTSTATSFDLVGNYLSQNALDSAGFGAGSTVTVNPGTSHQAAFMMPAANSDGTDNVIADGQTVNLPSPVVAGSVDLLVGATCTGGATPYKASSQVTVNFSGGGYQSTPMPAVPDWSAGNLANTPYPDINDSGHTYPQGQYISQAVSFTQYDHGVSAVPYSGQISLYHVSIPISNTDPAVPVTSVTLPYMGTTFVASCATPALHVLAISTAAPPPASPTARNLVTTGQIEGSPTACPTTAGSLEQFWNYNADGTIYSDTQAAPNSSFSGNLSPLGTLTTAVGKPAVANNGDGSLLVAATTAAGNIDTDQSDPCGNFTHAWTALGAVPGNGAASDPALAVNQNGTVQVAVDSLSGAVYTQTQTSPGGAFSGTWTALPGVPSGAAADPVLAHNQNGQLEIFVTGNDGTTYTDTQTAANGPYGVSWIALSGLTNITATGQISYKSFYSPQTFSADSFRYVGAINNYAGIGIGYNADGRLQIAITASNSNVYTESQTAANGGFSGNWAAIAGISNAGGDPVLALNQNGDLEIAVTATDGTISTANQTSAGASFGTFTALTETPPGATSGNIFTAIADPVLATNADGALQITDNTNQQNIIYTQPQTTNGQTAANGNFNNTWGYI